MGLKIRLSYHLGLCLCLILTTNTAFAKQQKVSISDELSEAYHLLFGEIPRKNQLKNKLKHGFFTKTGARQRAILIAKKQLRKKYRWGGTSPKTGFDCSGLMQYAYKKVKVDIPRTANAQYKHTKRVSLKNLQAGDLIFFHTRRTRTRVNHVGLYLGDGEFIHAPRRGKTVTVAKLNRYWRKKTVGAGRI